MNECFICGARSACEHREITLLPKGPERKGRMTSVAAESTGFRKKNPRRTEQQARKLRARSLVKIAVDSGILRRPTTCAACANSKQIQAHHTDYNNPLEVVWLCKKCHSLADAVRKIADIMPVETVEKLARDRSLEIPAQLFRLLFHKQNRVKSINSGEIDSFHRAG